MVNYSETTGLIVNCFVFFFDVLAFITFVVCWSLLNKSMLQIESKRKRRREGEREMKRYSFLCCRE